VGSDERTANLLGALALTLSDRAAAAVQADARVSGSDAAALVTLRNYAEGEPLDLLRRALALSHPGVVRLADRLQARGLVKRHRARDTRRRSATRPGPDARAHARGPDDGLDREPRHLPDVRPRRLRPPRALPGHAGAIAVA
jgi:DNA-binding MarR family transcriptional regulator